MPVYVYPGLSDAEKEQRLASMLDGLNEARDDVPRDPSMGGIAFPPELVLTEKDASNPSILSNKMKKREAYLKMRVAEVHAAIEAIDGSKSFMGAVFPKGEAVDTKRLFTFKLDGKKMVKVELKLTPADLRVLERKCRALAVSGSLTLVGLSAGETEPPEGLKVVPQEKESPKGAKE